MKPEDEIKELTVNPPIGMTAAQLELWLMGYNACLFRVREHIKQKRSPNGRTIHAKHPTDCDTILVYDDGDEEEEK